MRDLILATQNPGKLKELREALQGLPYRILSPSDLAQALPLVEETGTTLLENAQLKARAVAKATGLIALADDSGLEVDALEGAPGVFSARWAGPEADDAANNKKLLEELGKLGDPPRGAVFRTVLVLAEPGGREEWVGGRCEGMISHQALGAAGFGYDPLFFVPAAGKTFAQMTLDEKARYSHRGDALRRARKSLERW